MIDFDKFSSVGSFRTVNIVLTPRLILDLNLNATFYTYKNFINTLWDSGTKFNVNFKINLTFLFKPL